MSRPQMVSVRGHATIHAAGCASVGIVEHARCFATGRAKVRAYSAANLVSVKDQAMARVSGGAVVVAEDDTFVMVINDAWVELRDRAVAMQAVDRCPRFEPVGGVRVGVPTGGFQVWQVPGTPRFSGFHPNMFPY